MRNISGTDNASNNVIIGNTGNNSLSGGGGNDTITGGAGQYTLTGGTGKDTFVVTATTDSGTSATSRTSLPILQMFSLPEPIQI